MLAMVAATLAVAPLAACTTSETPPPKPPPATGAPAELTFGAFGTEDEIDAYTQVVGSFNSLRDDVDVELEPSADARDLVDRIRKGGDVPDVFMVSRDDLSWLVQEGLTQPIDVLLDERGVDFGDGYSRDGLQAFSADDRLQCMPYGISPRVVFYNTQMVDFAKMERRGLVAPVETPADERARTQTWTFDEFTAAAEYAARPRLRTRGVYVAPTLESLAPFIYSGGGQLFDDDEDPTSLAFSDGDTRDALERSLGLLRSPLVTPSQKELQRHTPLEMFESGKLAMIQGYRELVPRLRQVQGLEFDVMPMPVLDQPGTVGQVTGLCMSADTRTPALAADFMVKMMSTEAVQRVAHAGYLVPANLEVALSDDFLQPGRLPAHAGVFNASVRSIVFPPLMTTWADLELAVRPLLEQLLNEPLLDDLDALTEQIDEESRTVLDPENASPSPSESASD
jgi:multiple sugar transport system substrate-binding protein